MDFYIRAGVIVLGVIVVGIIIYTFTVHNNLVFGLIDRVEHDIYHDMMYILYYDFEQFDNNRAVSGTTILQLARDVGTHDYAILIQTRAQNGTVVNYGVQLRGTPGIGVPMNARADNTSTGVLRDWEETYVFSARSMFGRADIDVLGDAILHSSSPVDNLPNTGRINALYLVYNSNFPRRVGVNAAGDIWNTPTLSLWDTFFPTVESAMNEGRTYSTSGMFFTHQSLAMALDRNHNVTWATTRGSPYYINMTSQFHSVFILDQNNQIIGIYFEEHGVHNNSSILAQAQIDKGLFTATLPHD